MSSHLIAQKNIKKALEEDPSIFEYDEVYDEIKKDKEDRQEATISTFQSKKEIKSRYVGNLLKTAEKRKKDLERRFERKVQKEREAEGDEFSDKPTFVTSAYKQKLAELKAEEQREKLEEAIEEAMDVKKQKDLSGFYKFFLNNQLCAENKNKKREEKEEVKTIKSKGKQSYRSKESRQNPLEDDPTTSKKARESVEVYENKSKVNRYMHEGDMDQDNDDDENSVKEDNTEIKSKKKEKRSESQDASSSTLKNDSSEIKSKENKDELIGETKEQTEEPKIPDEPKLSFEEIKKQKLEAIFSKRTVNEAFEAARQKYLERVASRSAGS